MEFDALSLAVLRSTGRRKVRKFCTTARRIGKYVKDLPGRWLTVGYVLVEGVFDRGRLSIVRLAWRVLRVFDFGL